MDTELIEIELEDATTLGALATTVDREEEVSTRTLRIKIGDVAAQVSKVAEQMVEQARRAKPTDIEVVMRVGFSVSNGKVVAVLVDGEVTGAVELKMAWKDIARRDG